MDRDTLPIDAQILGDAIIELNISRHNVAIYPENHPSVKRSLEKAYELLGRLFELRPEITLAIAQDALIVDNQFLDKKNSVFREFARHLNRLHIAHLTFNQGLVTDELYAFHRVLCSGKKEVTKEDMEAEVKASGISHIGVGFIDYGAFSFEETRSNEVEGKKEDDCSIWEKYIYGLMSGTLNSEGTSELVAEMEPHLLAEIVNRAGEDNLKEESYDRVITAYVRRSSERKFSTPELRRLFDVINSLNPRIKKQFLSSAVNNISMDMEETNRAIKGLSVGEIINLLGVIDEQEITIPDALKNLLDKFSGIGEIFGEDVTMGNSLVMDDILLSPDVRDLLKEGDFSEFVTKRYQEEIKRLMAIDISQIGAKEGEEMASELREEILERENCRMILEVIATLPLTKGENEKYISILKEKSLWFVETGQCGALLEIIEFINNEEVKKGTPEIREGLLEHLQEDEFVRRTASAMRSSGRLNREDAASLCLQIGSQIVGPLLDELVEEDAKSVRRFLIGLIVSFKEDAAKEAAARLEDPIWFVTRNMLFILNVCGGKEVLDLGRQYLNHDHLRVRAEALKIQLDHQDPGGPSRILEYIGSEKDEDKVLGLELAGRYRIREAVPLLIAGLQRRSVTGKDLEGKIGLIRVLGEIGDPRALNAISEVLKEKSFLFKGLVENMKKEVFRSLKYYPYDAVEELVKRGARSKNPQIRKESLKLMKQKGKNR